MKSIYPKSLVILLAISLGACAGLRPQRSTYTQTTSNTSGVTTDSKPLTQTSVEPQALGKTETSDSRKAESKTETPAPASAVDVQLVDAQGKKSNAPAEATSNDIKPMTKVEVPANEAHDHTPTHVDAHTDPHAHSGRHAGPIPAEKALGWLKNGNTRYLRQTLRKDGQGPNDIRRLASGQQPHSIVLSCSDSRVPPEVLFDQKLGEIFVVRTAGESLDAMAIASIEYAVSHLGSNLIVVMGHESCGAVKAAHGTFGGKDAGSEALNKLVADIQPRIKEFEGQTLSKGALLEGWANVKGVAKDLLERSEIIRQAVATGEVRIEQAVYHLSDGHVEWAQ